MSRVVIAVARIGTIPLSRPPMTWIGITGEATLHGNLEDLWNWLLTTDDSPDP